MVGGFTFKNNLSWIFIGNIVHALGAFVLNVLVARQLGTDQYGLVTYGLALVTFATSVCNLGLDAVITRFFAEDEKSYPVYLGSGIVARLIVSAIGIAALQAVVAVSGAGDSKLQLLVLAQSSSLAYGCFDLFVYWFRYKYRADIPSILRMIAFAISGICQVFAVVVASDIILYAVSYAAETGVYALLTMIAYWKIWRKRLRFSFSKLKQMLVLSVPFIFSSILSTVYGQTDRVMLNAIAGSSAVAYYSVSATLAGAISIIPIALIEGFRPSVMELKFADGPMYRRRLSQLYAAVFWICIAYCLFITVFAEPIIRMMYGDEYLPAVPALSLIVWYTSFSYFGAINNVYMVAEGKTKWVPILTGCGALINIVLNLALIPGFGIVGASAASLLTQVITNFLMFGAIPELREGFKLMLNGIALRGIRDARKD